MKEVLIFVSGLICGGLIGLAYLLHKWCLAELKKMRKSYEALYSEKDKIKRELDGIYHSKRCAELRGEKP